MEPERWQTIQDVLAEALEREPEDRAAFVAERCGDDDELRLEVVSLLEASEAADDYFGDLGDRAGIDREPGDIGSATTAPDTDDSLIGRNIAHFRVTGFLGRGGMGKVYRAEDSQLNREVALKVLSDELVGDPEQTARLKREAQALAALNHPNIAAIYGLEEIDNHHALVLELIDGNSLADILKRGGHGRLRLEETLDIARQVAGALEAAHEAGIVHRDLKPANIAITGDDKAKVLDFGIAKALQPHLDVDGDPEWSPTEVMAATQPGRIMGTVSYMSPEQARGKPVDSRTDVWAFGCVLYEMLVGKKAFGGESATDSIVAILEHEPDWDALPDTVPAEIRALLHRCLRKDPRRRQRSIGDAWLVIDEVLEMPASSRVSPSAHTPAWVKVAPWAAVAVLGAVAVWMWTSQDAPAPEPTRRLEIAVGDDDVRAALGGRTLALSPDGSTLVHTSPSGLSLRPLNEFGATAISGTVGAESPFFSANGEWIGYFARGNLWKVSVRGGAPFELCEATTPRGAHWDIDDVIIFSNGTSLWQVSGAGGDCTEIAVPNTGTGEIRYEWPTRLSGGGVLFEIVGDGWSRLSAMSASQDVINTVSDGGSDPRYLRTGHVVYARGGSLFAVQFDPDSLTTTGDPRPVLEGVRIESTGAAHAAFAADGSVAYVPTGDPDYRLVWVDRDGAIETVTDRSGDYSAPRISPDGTQIALAWRNAGEQHIWVHDIERDVQQRVTSEGSNNWPDWTPDGDAVIFSSGRRGPASLWRQTIEGGTEAQQVSRTNGVQYAVSTAERAPVGVFFQVDSSRTRDIWALPLTEGAEAIPVVTTGDHEQGPALSPNAEWLAYVSNASGRNEVYVQPCLNCTDSPPQTNAGRRQVSFNGGGEPVWNASGTELFYREGDRMMSVTFDPDDDFRPGRPAVVFEGRFAPGQSGNRYYDVHPDGERFLMLQGTGPNPLRPRINVVLNWSAELAQAFGR